MTLSTRIFIITVILISFITNINSQNNTVIFNHIDSKSGLSHNRVYDIAKDAKGYMWFATLNGLNRFDGYNFKIFKHNILDSTSISENLIEDLFFDSHDNLWVATNFSGMNKFIPEKEEFIRYDHNPENINSIADGSVHVINQLNDSSLLIGTNNGLSVFSIQTELSINYRNKENDPSSLVDNEVRDLLIDHNQTPWIGTANGLSMMDTKTNSFVNYKHKENDVSSLSDNYILSLAQTSDSTIWVGTANGLNCFNTRTKQFTRYYHQPKNKNSISNNYIHSLQTDNYGNLWVGTSLGISKIINPNTNKKYYYHYNYSPSDPTSLSGNKVWCLYIDRDDLLWAGTVNQGINKCYLGDYIFNNEKHVPHDSTSLSHSTIRSLFEDTQGNLWVGTDGGGVNIKLANQSSYIKPNNLKIGAIAFGDNRILDIFESKAGDIWIGTWGAGVSRIKSEHTPLLKEGKLPPIQYFRYSYLDSTTIGGNVVQEIYQDSNDNIWFGTEHGISIFNPIDEIFYHVKHIEGDLEGLCDNRVQSGCILEDSQQQIWIGTWNGLSRIKLRDVPFKNGIKKDSNKIADWKFDNILNVLEDKYRLGDNRVISLKEDNMGNMWVGTFGGGLNKIELTKEKPIVTKYDKTNGLPDEVVYGIEKGNKQRLWLSTNYGLSQFDPIEERFTNFTQADYLQGNEFYWGAHLKRSDGELVFGGTNGFTSFYADSISKQKSSARVVISSMSIHNLLVNYKDEDAPIQQPIEYTKEVTLSHDQNVISFDYACLNYIHPELVSYSYMLEGFETTWNNVESRRTAIYTNLDPGRYTFKVKITGNESQSMHSTASISIIIKTPFYKNNLFSAVLLLLVVLISFAAYKLKSNNVARQQKMLQEKVAERTIKLTKANDLLTEKNKEIKAQHKQIKAQNDALESHRADLENIVNKRTEELNKAKERAEESDRLKSSFLANMSHEIRTPLNAVVGFSTLLDDDSITKEDKEMFIRQISHNSDALLLLIDDIIDLSHIEVGQLKVSPTELDLNSFINGIAETYHSKKLKENVAFRVVNTVEDESLYIDSDSYRLRQIIINLINNALKFTAKGYIELGLIKENMQLKMYVKDTGIGISPNNQKLIFERFRKIDDDLSKLYGGSGLGLTISKRLSELLGVELCVNSEINKGSTFFIVIPDHLIL